MRRFTSEAVDDEQWDNSCERNNRMEQADGAKCTEGAYRNGTKYFESYLYTPINLSDANI